MNGNDESPWNHLHHPGETEYSDDPANNGLKESSTIALPIVSQPDLHTMGDSLQRYIEDKLPSSTLHSTPFHIVVRPFAVEEDLPLTSDEVGDKTLIRHRPYARYNALTNNLEIICVPGADLIKHYASLAATYWDTKMPGSTTSYSLPHSTQCYDWIRASNIRTMGHVDTVILGYVDRLSGRAASQTWNSGLGLDDHTRKLFAWQICHSKEPHAGKKGSVAFLRCFFNFWGDIASSLVEVLQDLCGVRQVLYIGKAGSLRADDEPNNVIATGCDSWLNGTRITWQSALKEVLDQDCPPEIQTGSNISVYSPLVETHRWLSSWQTRCQWVDCEVGYFALACTKLQISFGYLNLISDNVAKWHEHDLTSELLREVKEKRQRLLNIIEHVLNRYLDLPAASHPQEDILAR